MTGRWNRLLSGRAMMPSLGAIVGDIVLDYVYSNFFQLVSSQQSAEGEGVAGSRNTTARWERLVL
jgi:hypothetical protein